MEYTTIPNERLKLFISSAQRKEDEFDWTAVRRRIKDRLSECPFINPFIIEDICSDKPSAQVMESEVRSCDFLVLIIRGEVRPGTKAEYTAAIKHGIGVHAYFIDTKREKQSAKEIKAELRNADTCTYRKLDTIDDIEDIIIADVIEDCIRGVHRKKSEETSEEAKSISVDEIENVYTTVPTKEAIEEFKECYNVLPELLGLDKQTDWSYMAPISQLGAKVQEWLLKGGEFGHAVGEHALLEYAEKLLYGKWISDRWKAIDYRLNGNLDKALEVEKRALNTARADGASEWLINDILIDCRNLSIQIEQLNKVYYLNNEAQDLLSESKTPIHLPVADRYEGNALERIINEDIELALMHHDTMRYGSSLNSCITSIQDYLFTAIYYGSITHIMKSRDLLAKALYKIGKINRNSKLIFQAARLFLIGGETSLFRKLIKKEWDNIYSYIASEADDIWADACNSDVANKKASKLVAIELIGTYVSDLVFDQCEAFIINMASEMHAIESEQFFKAVNSIVRRFDCNKLIDIIVKIIDEKRFQIGKSISTILINIDYESVTDASIIKLRQSIQLNLSDLINNNFDPQAIAILYNTRRNEFDDLSEQVEGLLINRIEKDFFKLNINKGDKEQTLIDTVEMEEHFYEAYKDGDSYAYLAYDTGGIIASITRDCFNSGETKRVIEVIEDRYFPLCEKVMNSKISVETIINTISTLCSVCGEMLAHGYSVPTNLMESINCYEGRNHIFGFFSNISKVQLIFKLNLLRCILGVYSKEKLLTDYLIESTCEGKNKVCLSECVMLIAEYLEDGEKPTNAMLNALILQCCEHELMEVRRNGMEAIAILCRKDIADNALKNKFFSFVCDPSDTIRLNLARICKLDERIAKETRFRIIEVLKNDGNFTIREYLKNYR